MTKKEDSTHTSLSEDLHELKLQKERRGFLRAAGGALLSVPFLPFFGACSSSSSGTQNTATDSETGSEVASEGEDASSAMTCPSTPEETAGPYPGDGSNGANALALSGIVRQDIRKSIAGATGTAEGFPLSITLTLVDRKNACAPLAGYIVYVWHCDRNGKYSMYDASIKNENYLRGVQQSDANGKVTFTTIFPACYSGRWPHIHVEVYPNLAAISSAQNAVLTSQIALPKAECDEVFATSGYSSSVTNFSSVSLTSDNVFGDGYDTQLAAMTGSIDEGFEASLTVGV